ncbi:hypothetical protein LARI1_G006006 [Lachnellula arida]|uniref:DUF1446 domain-containing protein n=1 Tax=Lachnellula arida TaxID=1316785 RepID=A0A8T9BBH8_9HELO|nr:hypothetical protein LARI1_G006006 [Lachnellula arida]
MTLTKHEQTRRPVRIANCSGAQYDPGRQMRKQARLGAVDFLTGDWLAENNLAQEAAAMASGTGAGFKTKTWDALQQSMDVIASKRIKVVVNGGGLNPRALAWRCQELINTHKYDLKVAFVSGDDRLGHVSAALKDQGSLPRHFHDDVKNAGLDKTKEARSDLTDSDILAANAYLGARAIVKALEKGADITICGRVADASPVVAAAWWWHGWADQDYDRLAGALIAGHLVECSAYVTGSNFSGFHRFDLDTFVDVGFPIVEVAGDGTCIITKHEGTNGMVTEDTVRCQLLYEIQGSSYLNSDVKAILDDVEVHEVDKDRVRVSGVIGRPPPPTTKLAIFYAGGFEAQILVNAAGYATAKKFALFEKQIRTVLSKASLLESFTELEFQVIGVPQPNPASQLQSTTYCRIYMQSMSREPIIALSKIFDDEIMQHYSGWHMSADLRTMAPKSFYAYYPAILPQDDLDEAAHLLDQNGNVSNSFASGHPSKYEALEKRPSYDSVNPLPLDSFGPTTAMRLGNLILGRSGDKGPNINCGLFVHHADTWDWFRSFMTLETFTSLIGADWKDDYHVERVEFPKIYAVHFVIYGILGRGVSSSKLLDNRGKGFADYIRDKHVYIPDRFPTWSDDN